MEEGKLAPFLVEKERDGRGHRLDFAKMVMMMIIREAAVSLLADSSSYPGYSLSAKVVSEQQEQSLGDNLRQANLAV